MQTFYSLYNKYFYYLFLTLMVFIPLYPKFPLINIAGTYVAIRIEDLLILMVILIWFLANLKKLRYFSNQTIFQSLLLFWAFGALSLLSALFITYSILPHLGLLHWLRRVEYMSLFFIAATSIRSLGQVKIATIVFVVTTLIVSLYGFGQIFLRFPVISTTNREFSKGLVLFLTSEARVNSTFAGHYDLAIFLSIALMFITILFFYYKNFFQKAFVLITGMLSFILLGLTAARVSFVAALIGLASILWLTKHKILMVVLCLAAFGLVGAIPELRHRLVATVTVNLLEGGGPKYNPPPGAVTKFTHKKQVGGSEESAEKKIQESTFSATQAGAIQADTVPGEPVNPTELGVYRSFGIRFDIEWPRALAAFSKNPFLGTGYSSISLATDNDYLRALGETGLLGAISLILVFFVLIKAMVVFIKSCNQRYEKFFVIANLAAMIAVLITTAFIDLLEASKAAEMMWLIFGIAWAVITNYSLANNRK